MRQLIHRGYNATRRLFSTEIRSAVQPRGKSSLAEIVAESGLFDENWYRERHEISEPGFVAALNHYLAHGKRSVLSPHPLFDVGWYRGQNLDLVDVNLSPLEHYVLIGKENGKSPHPLFKPDWYLGQASDIATSPADAFAHFLRKGAVAGLSPHPLFDSKYYLQLDPSIAYGGVNPLTHFVECGAREGKNPNRFFKVSWYLNEHPLLLTNGRNPLAHFISEGAAQGFNPHPSLDLDRYIASNDDLPRDRLAAYIHLVTKDRDRVVLSAENSGTASIPFSDIRSRVDAERAAAGQSWSLVSFEDNLVATDRVPPMPRDDALEKLAPDLADAAVLSFDIWDTVLRRDCQPDEVKLQSARFLLLRAFNDLRPAYRDLRTLLTARLQAENDSAPNDEHEYRFFDAVDRWLASALTSGVPAAQRNRIRLGLYDHELSAESRCTRVDAATRDFIYSTDKVKIYASDFYMSSEFMQKLLDAKGVGHQFVKGYVSSDTFKTKRSGRLFDQILSDFQIEPSALLHVGDHPDADVAVPERKGIRASHFVVATESERRAWFDAAFWPWRQHDPSVHHRRLARLAEDAAASFDTGTRQGSIKALGARIAPLIMGYVLSILEDALRSGVDRVFYFTREGLFFRQVHEALVRADPFNMTYPASEILHVSRRATFAASLKTGSVSELMRLWTLYSHQSIRGLCSSLNLDHDMMQELADSHQIPFAKPIKYPWTDRGLLKLLNTPAFQDHAKDRIAEQNQALMGYLKEKGLFDRDLAIVADIGWRGSIQDNLALLDNNTFIRGHYLGLFGFLNKQSSNTEKHGWLFDDNTGILRGFSEVAPFEMIFNGPGGSVTGYRREGTSFAPMREVHAGEENVITDFVRILQEGVLDTVSPIADYLRVHGLTSEDLRILGLDIATGLVTAPPVMLADEFQKLHHNETFGTGDVQTMAIKEEVEAILRGKSSSETHAAVKDLLSATRWPESFVRSSSVQEVWDRAPSRQRLSLPAAVSSVYAPARLKARGSRLSVFAPPPLRSSGGHRTIYNIVRAVAKLGFEPHIFLEGIGDGLDVVEGYLADTAAILHTEWHRHIPSDVALATIAHSAEFVASLSMAQHKSYLVQDFEALFNPMSDRYVTAENSYAHGLQHFTIGNWLTHVINTQFGAAASPAGLGVDTAVYHASIAEEERMPSVCFLYQPDKPRRAPALGIDALRMVKRALPEAKIVLFGSNLPLNLDFEVENLGLVQDLDTLNRLYQSCTAGLCISGTNPSRIPYEMMAAGCVPIDLYRYNNLLDHQSGTILLAYQDSASIAEALLKVLGDVELAETMSIRARQFASSRSLAWECDVIANSILAMIDGTLPPFATFELLYGDEPVIGKSSRSRAVDVFCQFQQHQARRSQVM